MMGMIQTMLKTIQTNTQHDDDDDDDDDDGDDGVLCICCRRLSLLLKTFFCLFNFYV
jgi:hypothetical protein